MRTANPVIGQDTFLNARAMGGAGTMTINGAVNKAGILTLIIIAAAAWSWSAEFGQMALIGSAIGGLILAIATTVKPNIAPVTSPIYAALEGIFLGIVSRYAEQLIGQNIVFNAVMLTFATLAMLLIAYRMGFIKVTQKFRAGVFAATGALALVYLISFGLSFFGIAIPLIHGNGPMGILFSLVAVGLAALNLVLDFDLIERGANARAPKYMEWYGAFALIVTLVWLYMEILRLLMKLQSRD